MSRRSLIPFPRILVQYLEETNGVSLLFLSEGHHQEAVDVFL